MEGEGSNFINTPPVAKFILDDDDGAVSLLPSRDNGVANFDASDSFDSDGVITQYQWDFKDDSDDSVVVTTEPTVTHKFTTAGTYQVTLTVIDNNKDDPQAYGDYILSVTVRNL